MNWGPYQARAGVSSQTALGFMCSLDFAGFAGGIMHR